MKREITILLAEDDEDDVFLFKHALSEIKTAVSLKVVADGSDVIDCLCGDFIPDLIFLDINMPKLNGIECLQQIKSLPALSRIPVIFLSTNSGLKIISEVKDSGAKGYISKPNSIEMLIQVLESVLKIDWDKNEDFFLR
ncbi:response regulator [Dyadobacter psychrotolerans]|uniref:response regulator n=1 Tax=Dyadobacter psychrotolerans TaxID=2541721 RepID=UPI001404BC3D|nr:response regulator [Dyadobacter psychrotolerans]